MKCERTLKMGFCRSAGFSYFYPLNPQPHKMKKALVFGLPIAFVLLIALFVAVPASNSEIRLRSQVTAQEEVCQSYFDKMWKSIQQIAQVPDRYKEAFKEIYPALIEARYANDNQVLFKFVTESNPQFDVALYKTLAQTIEAQRTGFFMEQKKLIDLNNQHRIVRKTWPNSWFIGSRPDIAITVITSEKTKKAYASGEDNDIDLFKK